MSYVDFLVGFFVALFLLAIIYFSFVRPRLVQRGVIKKKKRHLSAKSAALVKEYRQAKITEAQNQAEKVGDKDQK